MFCVRKEDLKKRLEELSSHYNESLATMKEELTKNVAKLIEAEKKYNDEIENKSELNRTIESQCAHLLEYELRYKNTLKQLQEAERTSSKYYISIYIIILEKVSIPFLFVFYR